MPQPHALAATYSRMRSRCRLTQGGTCHSQGLSVDEKCQTQKVIFKSEKYATRVFRVVAPGDRWLMLLDVPLVAWEGILTSKSSKMRPRRYLVFRTVSRLEMELPMRGSPHRNPRSWTALILGVFSLGSGFAWMLAAGWGLGPLDAFIAGSAEITGLTVGTLIVVASLVFLIGSWLLGSPPGWGTLIAFVGVAVVVDAWNLLIFDFIGWIPAGSSIALRIGLWVVGFLLFAGGVMATLASDLGANPYDQFVRAVHERFSISIGLARLIFDAAILVIAFALGGALGAGTVALLILMPLAMGFFTPLFRQWVHGNDATSR